MDISSSDPFVKFIFPDKSFIKSKLAKNSLNFFFNE